MPEQRKREIYAVCRKWDVMIIEDDPCMSLLLLATLGSISRSLGACTWVRIQQRRLTNWLTRRLLPPDPPQRR